MEALERYNDPDQPLNENAKAALGRLQDLGNLDRWHGDTFMKIFLDIDDLFFNRNIRDNVYVCWTCEPEKPALAYSTGVGRKGCPRVTIAFNIPHLVTPEVDVHEAIQVVIHEMCHAYLDIHCDSKEFLDSPTVDFREFLRRGATGDAHAQMVHSTSFVRCANAIQRRLGPTRYLYMAKVAGQSGGTVALGTPLRSIWDKFGGFMTEETFRQLQDRFPRSLPPLPPEHHQNSGRDWNLPWIEEEQQRYRGGPPAGQGSSLPGGSLDDYDDEDAFDDLDFWTHGFPGMGANPTSDEELIFGRGTFPGM